jgi:hypothetical protein
MKEIVVAEDWKLPALKTTMKVTAFAAILGQFWANGSEKQERRYERGVRYMNGIGQHGFFAGLAGVVFANRVISIIVAFVLFCMIATPFIGFAHNIEHQWHTMMGQPMLPRHPEEILANEIDYTYSIVELPDEGGDAQTVITATIRNPTDISISGVGLSCKLFYPRDPTYAGYGLPEALHTGAIPARMTKTFTSTFPDSGAYGLGEYTCILKYVDPIHRKWWKPIK